MEKKLKTSNKSLENENDHQRSSTDQQGCVERKKRKKNQKQFDWISYSTLIEIPWRVRNIYQAH